MVNMKVGIIGYGTIGSRVQKRCEAFGSEVIVYDPFVSEESLAAQGAKPVPLEKLLKEADIVTIHLRLSEKTLNFLGEKELAMLKSTAYVINTARAGLIQEEALIHALKERRICAAALDVYNEEPLPMDHPYMELDNVVLIPHLAGSSCDTMLNSFILMNGEMQHYCKGETFDSIVRSI